VTITDPQTRPAAHSPYPFGAGEYTTTVALLQRLLAGPQACVHRADGTVVALCGPADDPVSRADATLFANAPRAVMVLKAMVQRFRLSIEDEADAELVREAVAAISDSEGR
jgi:hypothetical protein